jgi:hypothetical protein
VDWSGYSNTPFPVRPEGFPSREVPKLAVVGRQRGRASRSFARGRHVRQAGRAGRRQQSGVRLRVQSEGGGKTRRSHGGRGFTLRNLETRETLVVARLLVAVGPPHWLRG